MEDTMKNQYIHSPRLSREQVQLVLENAPPEQTILIEGDNGIGKTSLMNQVAEKLSDGGRKLNVVFLNGKTMKDGDLAIPVLNKQTGTLACEATAPRHHEEAESAKQAPCRHCGVLTTFV